MPKSLGTVFDEIISKCRFVQRSLLLENLLLMVRVQPKGCPIHLLSSDSSWQVTCLEPKVFPIKSWGFQDQNFSDKPSFRIHQFLALFITIFNFEYPNPRTAVGCTFLTQFFSSVYDQKQLILQTIYIQQYLELDTLEQCNI